MRASFSQKLAELRQAAKISQKEAAAALQVSQSLLSHYEKGIREPGLDFVVRAADYYDVTCDELLGRTVSHSHYKNPYVHAVSQELHNAFTLLMDLMSRDFDPLVFSYARIYFSEMIYEFFRLFYRTTPDYDPSIFSVPDETFDAGGAVADLTLVRAQFIQALRRYEAQGHTLHGYTAPQLEELYGPQWQALHRLLRLVSRRLLRQSEAEQESHDTIISHATQPDKTEETHHD